VFITAVPITKVFAWGKGYSGGHHRDPESLAAQATYTVTEAVTVPGVCVPSQLFESKFKFQRRVCLLLQYLL
jgi:hypothetical protein